MISPPQTVNLGKSTMLRCQMAAISLRSAPKDREELAVLATIGLLVDKPSSSLFLSI